MAAGRQHGGFPHNRSCTSKHHSLYCHTPQDELLRNRCPPGCLDVWQRGVDTEEFHPRHRSEAMRARMSGGRPEGPILVYIGRLGTGTASISFLPRSAKHLSDTAGTVTEGAAAVCCLGAASQYVNEGCRKADRVTLVACR